MPSLDPGLLEWAVRAAAPGAEVAEVRGLRDGGSPWLVRLGRDGRHGVVLRVGGARDRPALGTEVAALRLAAEHRLPAPRLLAAELDGDPPVVLVEQLEGSSAIPADRPPARLRTLGRAAAALHAIALAPGPALPRRDRPDHGPARPTCSCTATCGRATPCGWGTRSPAWSTGTARAPARPASTWGRCAVTPPSASAWRPPTTSWRAGRSWPAGRRPTSPTGTWWPPSAPRRTWAGSSAPSPGRAGPTSPRTSSSGGATPSSRPPSTASTTGPGEGRSGVGQDAAHVLLGEELGRRGHPGHHPGEGIHRPLVAVDRPQELLELGRRRLQGSQLAGELV